MLQLLIVLAHIVLPVVVIAKFKFSLITVALMPFALVSVPLFREDIKSKRLPNRILYPAIFSTLALLLISAIIDHQLSLFVQPVGNAVLSFFGAFILYLVARGGFGAGDVKLFFLTGLVLGIFTPTRISTAAIISIFGAALYALFLLLTKRANSKTSLAFGPFIFMGTWATLIIFH